jgi:hypothetical protein
MAEIAAGLGMGAGVGVGMGFLSEYASLGILYAKWKALGKPQSYGKIAEMLQTLLDAEKDSVHGISSKGAVDSTVEFLDKTLDFAWLVDETIAHQLWQQIIHQSIAYAIHSSHGGSIGTMANVYAGSMYLSAGDVKTVGSNSDLLDNSLRTFLLAQIGQNIPSTALGLMNGANSRIDDVYKTLIGNVDSILGEWNDLALDYFRRYHTMCRERFTNAITMKEATVTRAYALLEKVANEHLARIVEQFDTLEGAKSWFDSQLLTSDELENISTMIDLEVQASIEDYNAHKTDILDAIDLTITDWDSKINQALGDMTDSEYRFCITARQMFDEVFTDVVEFVRIIVQQCESTIKGVCAYRNYLPAVQFSEFGDTAVTTEQKEIGFSRLPLRRWGVTSPITIEQKVSRLVGAVWERSTGEITIEPTKPSYRLLEKKTFEKSVQFTVEYPVNEHVMKSWVQVK